jgi:TP901 family phage tail tape measure protein
VGGNKVDILFRLLGKDSGFKQMMNEAQLASASTSQKMQHHMAKVGQSMSNVGKSMTVGVTLPIVGVGIAAVSMAAKFETSMNVLQAASGASAKQMKDLSAYAMEMGAKTMYSAGEAGKAMVDLAKGGMTAAQIKAGGLKAALDLAAAGDLELAQAAEVTIKAMGMFGIKAKNAASVADALAGGANASTASVQDLALAFAQVGPGAKTAGLTLRDTVAVLAAFADHGIRGSDAGTSLKTMLARLVPMTDKARGMMDRYNLSFVDGKGKIDDIRTVAEKLKDRLGGLSQEQRTAALATIFGSDATRAATILMEGGAKGLDKYMKATKDKTAAEKMAEARTKGYEGTMEALRGSIETVMIALGQVLIPIFTKVAAKVTTLVNKFVGLSDTQKKWVVIIAAVVAAIGPMLMIAGKMLSVLSNLTRIIRIAAIVFRVLSLAMMANPIGLIILAIVALVAIFVILWKKCDWFRNFWIAVWEKVKAVAEAVWPVIKAVGKKIIDALQWAWDKVKAAVNRFWDWAGPFITRAVKGWWSGIKQNMALIKAVFDVVWPLIKAVVQRTIDAIIKTIRTVKTVVKFIGDVWRAIRDVTDTVWGKISDIVGDAKDRILGFVNTIIRGINWVITQLNKLAGTSIGTIPQLGGGSNNAGPPHGAETANTSGGSRAVGSIPNTTGMPGVPHANGAGPGKGGITSSGTSIVDWMRDLWDKFDITSHLPKPTGGLFGNATSFLYKIVKDAIWGLLKKHGGGPGQAIIDWAKTQLGKPYLWGATGPDAYDCSGLIYRGYLTAGQSIPRSYMWNAGRQVSLANARPADVMFYNPGAVQDGVRVKYGHVKMYAGGGQTIESGTGGVHMGLATGASEIRTYLGLGGITRGLSIAGERGPEAVIPLTNPKRGAAVMREAGLVGGGVTINDNSRLVINLPPSLSPAQARSIASSEIAAYEARKAAARSAATRGMVRS